MLCPYRYCPTKSTPNTRLAFVGTEEFICHEENLLNIGLM